LQQLAQQNGVFVGSVWMATKLLHIYPYKIIVVLKLNLWIMEKEVCNRFIKISEENYLSIIAVFGKLNMDDRIISQGFGPQNSQI
jgi:hypothetical protein